MASLNLNPDQVIDEFNRRGVEFEPNEQSNTGFAMKVGSTGAAIPDWLFSTLDTAGEFGNGVG